MMVIIAVGVTMLFSYLIYLAHKYFSGQLDKTVQEETVRAIKESNSCKTTRSNKYLEDHKL